MTDPALVLVALAAVGRPIMLEYVERSSCIAATRMGLEVCRYFGIAARPQSVRMMAVNALARAAITAGEEPDWAAGAWSVGIAGNGQPQTPGGWDGHLVLVADRTLVDLSLDQASRPAKDLPLNAATFRLDDTFDHGEWVHYRLGPATVSYQQTRDLTWRTSPDWQARDRRWREPVARIIRTIRDLQEAP
jgi:hypothetical protein